MQVFLRTFFTVFAFLILLQGFSSAVADGRSPFSTSEKRQVVYVTPFQAVMVPPEMEERIFDLLVDRLNEQGASLGYSFVILKEAAASEWLNRQTRIAGELFGYLEESGCCHTELRLKSRAQLHRPGVSSPLVIDYPRELFFSHDLTSVEAQRQRLAEETAANLARRLLAALASS